VRARGAGPAEGSEGPTKVEDERVLRAYRLLLRERIRPDYGRILAICLKVPGLRAGLRSGARTVLDGRRLPSGVRNILRKALIKLRELITAGLRRNRVTIMQHGPGNGA
jgi:hypothetical protein